MALSWDEANEAINEVLNFDTTEDPTVFLRLLGDYMPQNLLPDIQHDFMVWRASKGDYIEGAMQLLSMFTMGFEMGFLLAKRAIEHAK